MKWVFLSLLLANIAYFVFQWQQPAPVEDQTLHPGASPDGGVLLLGEAQGSTDRQLEAATVLKNPVQVIPENDAAQFANRADESAVVERAVSSAGVAVVEPEAEGQDESLSDAESPQDVCWRMGAFPELDVTQDFAERLKAVGVNVQIKAVDAPTGDFDYRVVIPPMQSMQEAFRRLRELKSRNIDSYVMTQGANARGISLGLFSTESAALRHQASMKAAGYNAEILSIARVSRGYWLTTGSGSVPAALMSDLRSSSFELEMTETGCLN